MDHPCEKCGAAVEDGRPFCPQCRAPQIHVQIAVPEGETVDLGNDPGEGSLGIPPAGGLDRPLAEYLGNSDRGAAARAAIKAGVLGVFIGMLPIIGIVLTGSLAVYFYRREKGLAPATGIGARVGAAAGVVAFGINSLLIVVRVVVFHAQQEYIDAITKVAQAFGFSPSDPEIQNSIHNLFTLPGFVLTIVFGMIFAILLSGTGGALAALVFRPSSRL